MKSICEIPFPPECLWPPPPPHDDLPPPPAAPLPVSDGTAAPADPERLADPLHLPLTFPVRILPEPGMAKGL